MKMWTSWKNKFSKKTLSKKTDFRYKNIKKTESPKMTSKLLYELLIRSWERFEYFFCWKNRILGLKISKKLKVQNMTSKVLYELLIRSYERFKYFSQIWNLTISKSTSVNQRKCEHYGNIYFSQEKIQKM